MPTRDFIADGVRTGFPQNKEKTSGFFIRPYAYSIATMSYRTDVQLFDVINIPVSYTHLTLPTIYSV